MLSNPSANNPARYSPPKDLTDKEPVWPEALKFLNDENAVFPGTLTPVDSMVRRIDYALPTNSARPTHIAGGERGYDIFVVSDRPDCVALSILTNISRGETFSGTVTEFHEQKPTVKSIRRALIDNTKKKGCAGVAVHAFLLKTGSLKWK